MPNESDEIRPSAESRADPPAAHHGIGSTYKLQSDHGCGDPADQRGKPQEGRHRRATTHAAEEEQKCEPGARQTVERPPAFLPREKQSRKYHQSGGQRDEDEEGADGVECTVPGGVSRCNNTRRKPWAGSVRNSPTQTSPSPYAPIKRGPQVPARPGSKVLQRPPAKSRLSAPASTKLTTWIQPHSPSDSRLRGWSRGLKPGRVES
jgi:hypothetical protein